MAVPFTTKIMSLDSKAQTPHRFGAATGESTLFALLLTLSVAHMLNDTVQSLLPAVYPILKQTFRLSFSQVGLITLAFQLTASLLQPFVGLYTDKNPKPYSLPIGMSVTLCGLLLLAFANHFFVVLIAGGAGRRRLIDLPSGILARRAHGLRRSARAGAIPVPGRRQYRRSDRTVACSLFSSCRMG